MKYLVNSRFTLNEYEQTHSGNECLHQRYVTKTPSLWHDYSFRESAITFSSKKNIELIRRYKGFNPRNAPKGWHDFGSIEIDGEYYYFVIDQVIGRRQRVLARFMRILHSSEYPMATTE